MNKYFVFLLILLVGCTNLPFEPSAPDVIGHATEISELYANGQAYVETRPRTLIFNETDNIKKLKIIISDKNYIYSKANILNSDGEWNLIDLIGKESKGKWILNEAIYENNFSRDYFSSDSAIIFYACDKLSTGFDCDNKWMVARFSVMRKYECEDSDLKKDLSKKGYTVGKETEESDVGNYEDECVGIRVKEYFCLNGLVSSDVYDCKEGSCQDGYCKKRKCNDNEKGIDQYIFGTVTYEDIDGQIVTKNDFCQQDTLIDYYCSEDYKGANRKNFECENGCSNGVCNNTKTNKKTITKPVVKVDDSVCSSQIIDCGNSNDYNDCFKNAAKNCCPAKIELDTNYNMSIFYGYLLKVDVYTEIKGLDDKGVCLEYEKYKGVDVKYEPTFYNEAIKEYSEDFLNDMLVNSTELHKNMFEGKEGICKYPGDSFYQLLIKREFNAELFENIECSGNLYE